MIYVLRNYFSSKFGYAKISSNEGLTKFDEELQNRTKTISGSTEITTDQYGQALVSLGFDISTKYTVVANVKGNSENFIPLCHATYSGGFRVFLFNYNPFAIMPNVTITINWTLFLNE